VAESHQNRTTALSRSEDEGLWLETSIGLLFAIPSREAKLSITSASLGFQAVRDCVSACREETGRSGKSTGIATQLPLLFEITVKPRVP